MADYNSTFTGAQIDAGITKANSAQQPPAEGPFVDGDKTKLDGIEAGADVTDTANVTAAGALMDSEVTNLAAVKAFDPTDYATAAQGALADTAVQPGDDASTLGSGASLDGYVLTADGVGGAAWEVASGGGGSTDYVRTRAGVIQDLFDMADTWNDGATTFTAIKMNVTDTASDAASLLMDLQVGGVSQFNIGKGTGPITFEQGSAAGRTKLTLPQYSEISPEDGRIGISAGTNVRVWFEDGITVFGKGKIGFSAGLNSASYSSTTDVTLRRDGPGILAQREDTNAQTFNLYNTYTDASNYERLKVGWNANALELKPEAAGTGTTRVLHISGLPTANPGPGILWNDAGTVKVGT